MILCDRKYSVHFKYPNAEGYWLCITFPVSFIEINFKETGCEDVNWLRTGTSGGFS
jgi:hypothetical protein